MVSNISPTQYSEAISKFAEKKFQRDGVELITSARLVPFAQTKSATNKCPSV
jgi:hypothetical protein